jgi:homoserine kinase type II
MNVHLLLLLIGVIAASVQAFTPQRSFGLRNSIIKSTTAEDIGAVGSKLTNVELAKEALALWVNADEIEQVKMEATEGGVNNIVQYVELPGGDKKLLRIYNNGLDTQRVTFEHEVLALLHEQAPDLSFAVPKMIPAKNGDNKTFCTLSNGAEACLVDLIPGVLPKLTCVEAIGRASGELNTALSKLDGVTSVCNVEPYSDMWGNHHAVNRENFIEMMNGPDFDGKLRPFADFMLEYTLEMDKKIESTYEALPTQLIHGDLHQDNILVKDNKVTGCLDFEFAMYDYRAMEIAICLSKYAGEEKALEYFEEFISGYAETGVLTAAEAEAVPDLINLRVLSNVVYFVGRAIAKEDSIESLTSRIENYTGRIKWQNDNADAVINMIKSKMT